MSERRAALERFFASAKRQRALKLSPFTLKLAEARKWLHQGGTALDGVVAKRRDGPYVSGERAMLKVKQRRTADCVVGGFRYRTGSREAGSLLLGLSDSDGMLDHVGFTSTIANKDRPELTARLEALICPPGFTRKAPGGQSRWSTERSGGWEPLKPELVSRLLTTKSPATAFAMAPSLSAGVRTRPRANARSRRSSYRRSLPGSSPTC